MSEWLFSSFQNWEACSNRFFCDIPQTLSRPSLFPAACQSTELTHTHARAMSQKAKRKAVEEVAVAATTVPVDSRAEVDVVAKRVKTSADADDKNNSSNAISKDLDAVLDEAVRALSSQEPSSATAKVATVTAAPVAAAVGTIGGTAKPDRMSRWETNFTRLIRYIAEHGNARVPQSFHSADYPKLGKWVSRQRDAYRNEQLRASGTEPKRSERIDESQIARLNALNFEWVIPGRKKKNSTAKSTKRVGLKASVVASAVPVSAAPVKATAAPATAATATAPAPATATEAAPAAATEVRVVCVRVLVLVANAFQFDSI